MEYFTPSLLPSGNRLVTKEFCPGLSMMMTVPRSLQGVNTQSTADALSLGSSDDIDASTVSWIVGAPSSSSSSSPSNDDRHFWLVVENGDQYRLTSSYTRNDHDDNDNGDDLHALQWNATESSARPLVISRAVQNDPSNQHSEPFFRPLAQPSIASAYSSAVPTPSGGFLLVEHTAAAGSYQITQLSSDYNDITHDSLRLNTLVVDPLPDATLAYSSQLQLWAIYTSATDRYNHAVLGDSLEAHALTLLQWNDDTELVEFHSQTTLENESESSTVFEGLGAMWADVNRDGIDDIVTTISNRVEGARLRIYTVASTEGEPKLSLLAQAPAIGTGGRWLHQLAVGKLGPQGETELVEIRTPHIGGIVRYYRWNNDGSSSSSSELQLVASTSRYTSHNIGSRNLDQAVVGDFNGDGIPELVVQNQAKDMLVGLQRTAAAAGAADEGVETVWSIPLSSPVESNLAVSCSGIDPAKDDNNGGMILEIMFATEDNNLMQLRFSPTTVNSQDTMDDVTCRTAATTSTSGSGGSHSETVFRSDEEGLTVTLFSIGIPSMILCAFLV